MATGRTEIHTGAWHMHSNFRTDEQKQTHIQTHTFMQKHMYKCIGALCVNSTVCAYTLAHTQFIQYWNLTPYLCQAGWQELLNGWWLNSMSEPLDVLVSQSSTIPGKGKQGQAWSWLGWEVALIVSSLLPSFIFQRGFLKIPAADSLLQPSTPTVLPSTWGFPAAVQEPSSTLLFT